jgi:hypothetical protein
MDAPMHCGSFNPLIAAEFFPNTQRAIIPAAIDYPGNGRRALNPVSVEFDEITNVVDWL